jgi:transposase InsO family protein
VPRLRAIAPNQLWSWDITYLPTTVRGIWLYLYLVIDVWSRKVVAWDVAEREDPAIAADLVSRACLRERISKGRRQPLVLHADNGNAMRAATLESRLEELGVLRSFSRPRVSNDNPYSESLFRTAKYRDRTTRDGHLPARRRPASGWRRLSTGTTTGIAIAASNS